jgi:Glycosyltransferase family 87
MAVLVAAIHAFVSMRSVDGRDSAFGRPGHDGMGYARIYHSFIGAVLGSRDRQRGAPLTFAFLREAAWLGRARALDYSRLLFVIFAAVACVWIGVSRGLVDPEGSPLGTDFVSFWAASALALEGTPDAAYDPARHGRMEEQAVGSDAIPYYAWFYPPVFLLLALGLALIPYGWSLALWLAATGAAYVGVMRRFLPGKGTGWAALACPASLLTIMHGQNAFLSAALFGGGLLAIETRPVLAGALLGALVYKPQLACLVPVALVAARQWRALAAAAASATALAGAALAVFGVKTYAAFFAGAALARRASEDGLVDRAKVQTVFAALRLLGGSLDAAYAAQGVTALVAAAAVWWSWRVPARFETQAAVLVAASLLVSPFLLHYDLILLAISVACFVRMGAETGFLPWEKLILAAAWAVPLASTQIAHLTRVQVGPAVCALVLAAAWRRLAPISAAAPARA